MVFDANRKPIAEPPSIINSNGCNSALALPPAKRKDPKNASMIKISENISCIVFLLITKKVQNIRLQDRKNMFQKAKKKQHVSPKEQSFMKLCVLILRCYFLGKHVRFE